jgi:hypothetical protein
VADTDTKPSGLRNLNDKVKGKDTDDDKPPRASRAAGPTNTRRRQDQLQKVEDRLNELFATIALGQMAAAIATGDTRHVNGAQVTNTLSPPLVRAWVNLARENPAVARVLLRMSETSAWGEVAIASVGFVYSQGQAYGMVPASLPNPWISELTIDDVPAGIPDDPRAEVVEPIVGRTPPRSGVDSDESAAERAERTRKEVEERRAQRGS